MARGILVGYAFWVSFLMFMSIFMYVYVYAMYILMLCIVFMLCLCECLFMYVYVCVYLCSVQAISQYRHWDQPSNPAIK